MNSLSAAADVAAPVLLERRGAVAFLTLNRPAQFNALSEQMLAALHGALETLAAVQRGLINRCVAADRLDEEIDRWAANIAAKPRAMIAAGKALFYRQLELGVAAAYQLAGQAMACGMMEDVAQEGVLAFIEKRTPNWADSR
jgi:enoyl-CoA hydratase/carnithine racemase